MRSGEIAVRGVGQMRLFPLVKVNDTHVLGSGELGAIIPLCLLLYLFEIFHDKNIYAYKFFPGYVF